jgi:hypothetical protein
MPEVLGDGAEDAMSLGLQALALFVARETDPTALLIQVSKPCSPYFLPHNLCAAQQIQACTHSCRVSADWVHWLSHVWEMRSSNTSSCSHLIHTCTLPAPTCPKVRYELIEHD